MRKKTKKGEYINGKQTGMWVHWHSNGQKEEEGEYLNGKKIGEWNYWDWDENGRENRVVYSCPKRGFV